ncbi:hypothetical protein AGMMS50293_19940 [Spirochaetia bacterium]|nr:hypothetical protein AGMMS50293_19940 [Spirochaetia bacterium]
MHRTYLIYDIHHRIGIFPFSRQRAGERVREWQVPNFSDNMGAGASMGNQLRQLPDSSKVKLIVE